MGLDDCIWRGLPAWAWNGASHRIVVMRCGGHLAAFTRRGEALNPLWQPPWPGRRPDDPALVDGSWGPADEAPLLANIVGWNLCLDRFGPARPGEDRPLHGEAGVRDWTLATIDEDGPTFTCLLPQAMIAVERRFRLDGDRLVIETRATSRSDHDRDIEWAEHLTLGDPFLDGCRVVAAVDGAWTFPAEAGPLARFPGIEAAVEPALALAVPGAGDPACGDILAARVVAGRLLVTNPARAASLEVTWAADDFPWLCLWTEHRSRTAPPWTGRTRARGFELATRPFPEGVPDPHRATRYHDRPTTCRLEAGATLARSVALRWRRGAIRPGAGMSPRGRRP